MMSTIVVFQNCIDPIWDLRTVASSWRCTNPGGEEKLQSKGRYVEILSDSRSGYVRVQHQHNSAHTLSFQTY